MTYESAHEAPHYITRAGWLRAAVLGANDGIVSVASLIVGVAAAGPDRGAMSMAAGEYVSVSSQAEVERADIDREKVALVENPAAEEAELASIFQSRGLTPATAALVARELTERDALAAHVREELGPSEVHAANPLQAAMASGLTFTVAAVVPLGAAALAPTAGILWYVVGVTLLALAGLGALGAEAGGAPRMPATLRVLF